MTQPEQSYSATQPSHLTDNQYRLLRRTVSAGKEGTPIFDGNEERTARSLVRHGLAEWTPPGTRFLLRATDRGISFPQTPGRSR